MTILLPRSKTDIGNTGVRIVLAAAADAACPLTHMNELLTHDRQKDSAPLFRFEDKRTWDRNNVLAALRARLRRLGYPDKSYKGHSFRKGAAQEAYNNRLSEDQIQILGRWTSESVRRYYKTDPSRLYALQKQFQTGKNLPIHPKL